MKNRKNHKVEFKDNPDGGVIATFSHCDVVQSDIEDLLGMDGVAGFLFYVTRFKRVDFEILSRFKEVRKLAFLYCNLTDTELAQLEKVNSIKFVQFHDTSLTPAAIDKYAENNPRVTVYV